MLIGFFAYIAAVSPFFPDRPNLRYQPVLVLAGAFFLLLALARASQRAGFANAISFVRDWLPIFLTFGAFREMEFFLPIHFDNLLEAQWIREDRVFLDAWHVRAAIESFGKVIPSYLELCYLLVYGVAAYCVLVLYLQKRRRSVDLFFTIYLVGTLGAYALFPYFPSRPPRIVFFGLDNPGVVTWVRQLNLYILSKATIHVGVFPSAHVSSAFSATWAMFVLLPKRKRFGWGLLIYAISVSIATIYGRYHYAADVLAGFGISLVAAAVCLIYSARSAVMGSARVARRAGR